MPREVRLDTKGTSCVERFIKRRKRLRGAAVEPPFIPGGVYGVRGCGAEGRRSAVSRQCRVAVALGDFKGLFQAKWFSDFANTHL